MAFINCIFTEKRLIRILMAHKYLLSANVLLLLVDLIAASGSSEGSKSAWQKALEKAKKAGQHFKEEAKYTMENIADRTVERYERGKHAVNENQERDKVLHKSYQKHLQDGNGYQKGWD